MERQNIKLDLLSMQGKIVIYCKKTILTNLQPVGRNLKLNNSSQ